MPIVFGWLAGAGLARIAFSRVVVTALVWLGISVVGYRMGANNVSPLAGSVLAVGLPLAVLGWALHQGAASRLAIWLVEGVLMFGFVAMLLCVLMVVLLLEGGVTSASQAGQGLAYAAGGAALFGMRWLVLERVRRTDAALGDRSVLRQP